MAFIGGGLGLGLLLWGVDCFERAMQVADKPYWLIFSIDPVVVGFVAGICVLTALCCGLAPALQVFARNSYDVLKEGSRGLTSSRRAHWFSGSMVVAELALTLILVAGASLMMASFFKLYTLDIGVDTDRVRTRRPQGMADFIVNRAFVQHYLADHASTVGLSLATTGSRQPPHRIVGIVADARERGLDSNRTSRSSTRCG